MHLRVTEADRLAGPLWFDRWRALRRGRARALCIVAAGSIGLLLQWSRLASPWGVGLGVLLGATATYAVLVRPRMRALVPGGGAPWLREWKRQRRHLLALELLAVAVLVTGGWAVVGAVNDARGWLSVAVLVAGALLTLFVARAFARGALEASERAKRCVPAASDADVVERWRREDEIAERAEAAALQAQQRADERERRREMRRQESCLQQARRQALRRGPFFRRELVVPIRGDYVPLEELERNVRTGRWRIVKVEPDHRSVHHPAEYRPSGNSLLRAANQGQECKRQAWDERIPQMTQPDIEPFVAIAQRWNLRQLHHELTAALSTMEADRRAYVPTQLEKSIAMFLDSYDASGAPTDRP